MNKMTLVIGVSTNSERYSNLAVLLLKENNIPLIAVGKSAGKIGDIPIYQSIPKGVIFHTITLYINPSFQVEYYQDILDLNPKRIIFNPGTENIELENLALAQNIQCLNACTLVLLKTNQY